MKHSIRTKLTLIFVSIMAVVILLEYEVNKHFLESYYTQEKVEVLEQAYSAVDKMLVKINKQGKSITEVIAEEFGQNLYDSPTVSLLRDLNDRSNINVVLIDKYDNAIISASREGDWMEKKLRFYFDHEKEIRAGEFPAFGNPAGGKKENLSGETTKKTAPKSITGLSEVIETIYTDENYCIQRNYDKRSETSYLESWGMFSDGRTKFIMSMPISSIRESVGITNRFLLWVGILVLLCGSLIIYFVTKIIVDPINRLALLSRQMTKLDFSVRYEGKGDPEDEIGILGASMNAMSEQLERTIAELKTANNKLRQDIDEKNRIDELRKDFIANVSHELKTPIALIEGYAEGLVEGMAEDAESRDYYCGVIMDEAEKMNKMVKQLTSLNNLEFGSDSVEITRFDLAGLIRSVAEVQEKKAEEKGASIGVSLPETLFVWADEFKMEEVITNYLTNALNHVDGEKRILISSEYVEALSENSGKRVKISVYNDGANIPEEDLTKIWEKFYKVDKARTRAYGGSGIGLSIVKAILEAHNQSYGAENREGGVSFWFTAEADGSSFCEK